MRRAFLFLALSGSTLAQQTRVDMATVRKQCAPQAPASTLAALIHTESEGNPYALAIDFPNALLRRWNLPAGTLQLAQQPRNAAEALDWIQYFEKAGISVDVGLMQVSTAEARRRGIPVSRLLDPCANVRVGWSILEDFYQLEMRRYGPGQTALAHSLSRYNTGDTQRGIDNGYFSHVLASLRSLSTQEQQR
jgi:type IV secretion system protein VirB1